MKYISTSKHAAAGGSSNVNINDAATSTTTTTSSTSTTTEQRGYFRTRNFRLLITLLGFAVLFVFSYSQFKLHNNYLSTVGFGADYDDAPTFDAPAVSVSAAVKVVHNNKPEADTVTNNADTDKFPPIRARQQQQIDPNPTATTTTTEEAKSESEATTTTENNHENPDGSSRTTTTTATTRDARRLNVVVFFPDDMSHKSMQDVSGTDYVQTPFLSALARDGIRFTRNAVTSSICWMSRATLFTGQYVSQHGSERLRCPRFTLPQYWKDTWAAILQRVGGYHVGHVGKWQYYNGKGLASLFDWASFHEGRHWYTEKGLPRMSAADLASLRAVEFLRERPTDRPFALTVAFYPPKAVGNSFVPGEQWSPKDSTKELYANKTYTRPYDVDKAHEAIPHFLKGEKITRNRYLERWNTTEMYNVGMRNYHALVTEVDGACQQIVDELKNQGIYEDTMIIFSSDNGLMMGSHGLGGKWIAYEDSIRVPLIIYDPRMPKEKRGTLDDSMTLNVDLAETILGAANIDPPPMMQGRDISDLYLPAKDNNSVGVGVGTNNKSPLEEKPWRKDFFYEFPLDGFPYSYALILEQYKYIDWESFKLEQLFDLKKDPYELNDLLKDGSSRKELETSGVLATIKARYRELRDEIQTPNKIKPDWCNTSLAYTP